MITKILIVNDKYCKYRIYSESMSDYFVSSDNEINKWISLMLSFDIRQDMFTAMQVAKEMHG